MNLKEITSVTTGRLSVPAMSAASDFEMTDAGMPEQESLRVGKFLRHLLRMIVVEPDGAGAPREAIRRLRPFVDRARAGLQDAGETKNAARKLARARAQLLEGAVAGLCHVARFCAGVSVDSIVPPFAVAGVDIRMRHPSESSSLDLMFIVSENSRAQEQADRMIAFVLTGLSDLGFSANCATCMPSDAVILAKLIPGMTLTADKLHYAWGSFSLYERLNQHLPANDPCVASSDTQVSNAT